MTATLPVAVMNSSPSGAAAAIGMTGTVHECAEGADRVHPRE